MRRAHRGVARSALSSLLLVAAACEGPDPGSISTSPAVETIPSGCPAPPPGMTEDAVEAIEEVNRIRQRAGLGCIEQVPEIARAAERHCQYYVANSGPCIARPHREASDCTSFVAETFGDRLRLAGYRGHPSFEVMAYVGDGRTSVQHVARLRLAPHPHAEPRSRSKPATAPPAAATPWTSASPPPGAARLAGRRLPPRRPDGRPPHPSPAANPPSPRPRPPAGPAATPSPSTPPASASTQHDIRIDGTDTPLPHELLTPEDPRAAGLLIDEFMLYTHRPLAPQHPLPRDHHRHPRRRPHPLRVDLHHAVRTKQFRQATGGSSRVRATPIDLLDSP